MKLEKVAYNMDYMVYLDIYFMVDTAKVASSRLAQRGFSAIYSFICQLHHFAFDSLKSHTPFSGPAP